MTTSSSVSDILREPPVDGVPGLNVDYYLEVIWNKLTRKPTSVATGRLDEYYKLLQSWPGPDRPKSILWLQNIRQQHGDEYHDNFEDFFEKIRSGEGPKRFPDPKQLGMAEFRLALQHADWLKENTASKIVNAQLGLGDFESEPQFDLREEFSSLCQHISLGLRLNGSAVTLPETSSTLCDSENITTVLPNLYSSIRINIRGYDNVTAILNCVVLGNLMLRDRNTNRGSEDTGIVVVAAIEPDEAAASKWEANRGALGGMTVVGIAGNATEILSLRSSSDSSERLTSRKVFFLSDKEPEFVELGLKGRFSEPGALVPLFERP